MVTLTATPLYASTLTGWTNCDAPSGIDLHDDDEHVEGGRGQLHDDADVRHASIDAPAYFDIEQLFDLGITQESRYQGGQLFDCPTENVPREQMAAFLVRANGLSQLSPPTPTFADVPASSVFFGYVERLFEQGITQGCGTSGGQLLFCPSQPVPREQMAAFIVRAKGLTQLFPPTPTFADVPASGVFFGVCRTAVRAGDYARLRHELAASPSSARADWCRGSRWPRS